MYYNRSKCTKLSTKCQFDRPNEHNSTYTKLILSTSILEIRFFLLQMFGKTNPYSLIQSVGVNRISKVVLEKKRKEKW